MSEKDQTPSYGDPLSEPFWAGAGRRQLLLQRCADCNGFQFYPRPFCLACQSDRIQWVPANGTGHVYSLTVVHMAPSPEFKPPYHVAVVELEEGLRLTTNLVGTDWRIGDAVQVTWREREGAPPLPVFGRPGASR